MRMPDFKTSTQPFHVRKDLLQGFTKRSHRYHQRYFRIGKLLFEVQDLLDLFGVDFVTFIEVMLADVGLQQLDQVNRQNGFACSGAAFYKNGFAFIALEQFEDLQDRIMLILRQCFVRRVFEEVRVIDPCQWIFRIAMIQQLI
jgi:hypothetical protein